MKPLGLALLTSFAFLFHEELLWGAEAPAPSSPPAFTVQVTGSGRPMILIPGLSCGGNVWDDTVAHFKGEYECHVVTLAGFAGQPAISGPLVERVRSGLARYIQDKKLVRPVIMGHSLGAFMALWLGATLPDQVGPIIAVDGVPYYPALQNPQVTPDAIRAFAQALQVGMQSQTAAQYAASNRMVLVTMITDPKNVEKVGSMSDRSDPKAVGQAFYELLTIDLRDKVKAIQSPVLLLGETGSITSPDEKKKMEERYRIQVATVPHLKVVFAPKAKHFIQLDEPEFFYREVESFLKESAAAKRD